MIIFFLLLDTFDTDHSLLQPSQTFKAFLADVNSSQIFLYGRYDSNMTYNNYMELLFKLTF